MQAAQQSVEAGQNSPAAPGSIEACGVCRGEADQERQLAAERGRGTPSPSLPMSVATTTLTRPRTHNTRSRTHAPPTHQHTITDTNERTMTAGRESVARLVDAAFQAAAPSRRGFHVISRFGDDACDRLASSARARMPSSRSGPCRPASAQQPDQSAGMVDDRQSTPPSRNRASRGLTVRPCDRRGRAFFAMTTFQPWLWSVRHGDDHHPCR